MKSIYLKELKRYTSKDLLEKFEVSRDEMDILLKKLREYGILKLGKNTLEQKEFSDLLEQDEVIEEIDTSEVDSLFVFKFVGIIMIKDYVLKCYPKYIDNNEEPKEELKQVISVIEKVNQKEQSLSLFTDMTNKKSFNELGVILYLIHDYLEFGIYRGREEVLEINGEGEIDWNRTIEDTFMFLSDNRPFYSNLVTSKLVDEENNFIRQVHEVILTEAIQKLNNADILDLFGFDEFSLTSLAIEDLADLDYILYMLDQKLSIEFNTRNQMLLKSLYVYLLGTAQYSNTSSLSFFGTNSFHVVWEKACAQVLGNDLNRPLSELGFKKIEKPYQSDKSLLENIEKPLWSNGAYSNDTLIPDTIKVNQASHLFLIFDAKYYNLRIVEDKVSNYPGIGDVTKQFLYQMVYQDLIKGNNLNAKNYFVVPTTSETDLAYGHVSMNMFKNLSKIGIIKLNAQDVYDAYLTNQIMEDLIKQL